MHSSGANKLRKLQKSLKINMITWINRFFCVPLQPIMKLYTRILTILALSALPFSVTESLAQTAKTSKTTGVAKTAKAAATSAKGAATSAKAAAESAKEAVDNVDGEAIVRTAMQYIGVPYRSGSSSTKGFDCSGFTSFVYKKNNIDLLRSSRSQYTQGKNIKSKSDLQVGDLVFFTGTRGGGIGHVGIVTEVSPEDKSFKFVHARSKGVGVDDSKEAYYNARYVGARRIISGSETEKKENKTM